MKLTAFRIENFRSIVDTGWQNISPDNITCLIGQNESGKTSILEALNVFYSGEICEDVLRSDLSLPVVSCRFEMPDGGIGMRFPDADDSLHEVLESLDSLTLVRRWKADLTSEVAIGGAVEEYVSESEVTYRENMSSVSARVIAVEIDLNAASEKYSSLEKEVADLSATLGNLPGRTTGIKLFRRREEPVADITPAEVDEIKKKLQIRKKEFDEIAKYLLENDALIKAISLWNELQTRLSEIEERYEEITARLEERHQTMTLLSGPTLQELSRGDWGKVLADFKQVEKEMKQAGEELDRQVTICGFLIDGLQYENAVLGADKLFEKRRKEISLQQMGSALFIESPVFQMFEDFGSLLPNRIDLEEMISGDERVEGYKAARNFLTIAKLDYSFFQQPSSRILKQKIENLNSKLTLDFQDFWQQYVGSKNKIRINFEPPL
ncbi:MAG: AAA family ATPase [Bacteroidales bacterium]